MAPLECRQVPVRLSGILPARADPLTGINEIRRQTAQASCAAVAILMWSRYPVCRAPILLALSVERQVEVRRRSNMEFSGELFPTPWLWCSVALYGWFMTRALRWANWRRLAGPDQLNVFLGTPSVAVADAAHRDPAGFSWHLSGDGHPDLMFGWSLAVIAGSIALLAATLFGLNDWSGWRPRPGVHHAAAALTQVLLGLARLPAESTISSTCSSTRFSPVAWSRSWSR